MKILVGSFKTIFSGTVVDGHNCDFEYRQADLTSHTLCVVDPEAGQKYEYRLWCSYGECGSGWTTASWGHLEIKEVEFWTQSLSYHPKVTGEFTVYNTTDLIGDDVILFQVQGETVAKVSYDGCDPYYPTGYYSFKEELFYTLEGRTKEKRPLWVFRGGSGLGKSFLASKLSSLKTWESDSGAEFDPKCDVAVLGNKGGAATLPEVEDREVIYVDFAVG